MTETQRKPNMLGSRTSAELNKRSAAKRQALARVRHALRIGQLTIADVAYDPPAPLADRSTFEVLLMARNVTRDSLEVLGEMAIEDGVNLAKSPAALDERERVWLSTYGGRKSTRCRWTSRFPSQRQMRPRATV